MIKIIYSEGIVQNLGQVEMDSVQIMIAFYLHWKILKEQSQINLELKILIIVYMIIIIMGQLLEIGMISIFRITFLIIIIV